MALQSAHHDPFLSSCSRENPHLFMILNWEEDGGATLCESPTDQYAEQAIQHQFTSKRSEDKPNDR